MPLVLDPEQHSRHSLEALVRSLRSDLEELRGPVGHPRGAVLDPASLETARGLLEAALATLARPGPGTAGASPTRRTSRTRRSSPSSTS